MNIDLQIVKDGGQDKQGLWLFTMVRNEEYLLPHFLAHYQKLGIANFLVYDDHSTDGSRDILLREPNCTVITSRHSYSDVFGREARSGTPMRLGAVLKSSVPEKFLKGQWVTTVDADEFMILPPATPSLRAFIAALEKRGQLFAAAPMVDFYGETLNRRNYDPRHSPFDGNPYFDRGPLFEWRPQEHQVKQLLRGVRCRLLKMLLERRPRLTQAIYGNHPIATTKLWKVPLLKHGQGIRRTCDHEVTATPRNGCDLALAHFKFHPGLDAKIAEAIQQRQYYNMSMEYRFLRAALDVLGEESLLSPETCKFAGPGSLVEARLIDILGS